MVNSTLRYFPSTQSPIERRTSRERERERRRERDCAYAIQAEREREPSRSLPQFWGFQSVSSSIMNMVESSDGNPGVFMPVHNLGGFHHERNMFDEIIEGLRKGMEENRRDLSGAPPPPPYPCAGHKRSTCSDNYGLYYENLSMIDRSTVQRLPYPCAGYKRSSYFDSYGVYYENLSMINPGVIGAPTYSYAGCERSTYSDKNGVYCGDLKVSAYQPNFAAQIADKSMQQLAEETKKVTVSQCVFKECIGMDLYDRGTTSGDIGSVCMEMVEALLDEIKQEFDVADVTGEALVDIDANDKNNPNAVVEYIDDLYAYYKKVEISSSCVPNYMPQQLDLDKSMRAILIDWLIELHYNFELKEEALYLTVNLVDRFLAVQIVGRQRLQLVGMTALLLACKYEGSGLAIDDLVLIADQAYSRKELLEAERRMVNVLQFNLSVPTPYMFMRRFLKAAQSNKQLEDLSFFILDLCLVEYDMLRFPPSLLAAAAVYTSQCTLYRSKRWTKTCEKHTNYTVDQLLECSRMMVNLHKEAGTTKLKGVVRKYSTDRYGYVANAEPALFLWGN